MRQWKAFWNLPGIHPEGECESGFQFEGHVPKIVEEPGSLISQEDWDFLSRISFLKRLLATLQGVSDLGFGGTSSRSTTAHWPHQRGAIVPLPGKTQVKTLELWD
jgi:hypothetical protein